MDRKMLRLWSLFCAVCCCFAPMAYAEDDGDGGAGGEDMPPSAEEGEAAPEEEKAPPSAPPKAVKKAAPTDRESESVIARRKATRAHEEARLMAEWQMRDKNYQRAVKIAQSKGKKPPKQEPAPDFTRPEGKIDPIELCDGFYTGSAQSKSGTVEVIVRVSDGKIRKVETSAPDSGVRRGVIADMEKQVVQRNSSAIQGNEEHADFTQNFSQAVEKALSGKSSSKKPTMGKNSKKSSKKSTKKTKDKKH